MRRQDRLSALSHAEDGGAHARKAMAAYEEWLLERDVAMLRLLGLFDRPASAELVRSLKNPPITGLTDELGRLSEAEWNTTLHHLAELGLVTSTNEGALDTHPLVREHFGERLKEKGAAIDANNLSELHLATGHIAQATRRAREAVAHADRSNDPFECLSERTALADALHHAGDLDAARALFIVAEDMQAKRRPEYPMLSSLQGYQYGDLLLSQGEAAEARRRAQTTLPWAQSHHLLLDIALDHILLGRAAHALRDATTEHLDHAVTGLRQAGAQEFIVRGLLARAAFHRDQGNLDGATHDLEEATRVARRGGMRLFLADCALERARLALAQGDPEAARLAGNKAHALITDMAYHRRDPELAAIDAALDP